MTRESRRLAGYSLGYGTNENEEVYYIMSNGILSKYPWERFVPQYSKGEMRIDQTALSLWVMVYK